MEKSLALKKSDLFMPFTTFATAVFMVGMISGGFLVIQTNKTLPDAQSIESVELKIPLRVYSAEGLLISEFGNERRKPVSIEEVPQTLIDSILASEDDNFYHHRGIDIKGLIRSAISNFRTGGRGQGASTITMQVARNFFLTPEKTYIRKIKEILLAIKLEQLLSKDEILSLYINKIFLGHRAYGFGAAADVYYGRELAELNLAESAMLAGLPKAPSSHNPLRSPERAIGRRNYVLGRLKELNKISEEQYALASEAPVSAVKHGTTTELAAPHIAEMVRASLIEQYGEQVYWQGLNVYTTIVSSQQIAAEKSLRSGLQAYDKRHGFRGPITKFEQSKIDSLELTELAKLVAAFPNSHEQVPALVLKVDEFEALLLRKDESEVVINIKNSAWARKFLTTNSAGSTPKKMTQLLSVGDLIYIEPLEPNNLPKQDSSASPSPSIWRLSQIPNISGALVSMEPSTGKIFSLVGGYDFFLNKFNRAIQSIRQPGSNIKPFIYSASLDKGFSPTSLISGAPIVITDPAHGTVWRPENYSGKFFGPTRMREALSKSLNLVSIRLLRSIGIPYAREYVSRFGLDIDRFSSTLTMALGSGGVTPLQMLGAYGALANTGYRVKPYFIDYITDRDGTIIRRAQQAILCDECFAQYLPVNPDQENSAETLVDLEIDSSDFIDEDLSASDQQTNLNPVEQETYQASRIMRASNNFLTVSMLKGVISQGTARKALVLNRSDLAGKTGTTNDYVDAWFSGFNSKIATTVWVGFDDPATMGRGEAGSVAALPIWIDYMRVALKDIPEDTSEVPDFIEEGFVNKSTGERTDESDPNATVEYFPIESLLPELEKRFIGTAQQSTNIDIDRTTDGLFEEGLLEENTQENRIVEPRILEQAEDTEGLF